MGLDEDALEYHRRDPPGKVAIETTKPTSTQRDLSLAYSPGVAAPCREFAADPTDAYTYTAKGNLVGMVSNRSAVLGLGDIGAQAAKPVIEGKGSSRGTLRRRGRTHHHEAWPPCRNGEHDH